MPPPTPLIKPQLKSSNPLVVEFFNGFFNGIESLANVAKIAREAGPDFPEEVEKATQGFISVHTVESVKRIGVSVVPRLAYAGTIGAKRLTKMPLSVQEKYVSEPIPVITHGSDGWSEILVAVNYLTKEQCDYVFAADHVRTVAEQRAYIESAAASEGPKPKTAKPPYELRGKYIIIHDAETKIHVRDMLALCARAES